MGLHDIVHFLQDIGAAVLYDCWSVAIKKDIELKEIWSKKIMRMLAALVIFTAIISCI